MQEELSHKTPVSRLILLIVTIILLIALGILIGYYAGKTDEKTTTESVSTTAETSTVTNEDASLPATENQIQPVDATANWKTYTNKDIGFTFKYPNAWNDFNMEKYIPEFEGSKGNSYHNIGSADPNKFFSFYTYSRDYEFMYNIGIFKEKVNLNWTLDEFNKKITPNFGKIQNVKKLSDKSVVIAYYNSIECSPNLEIRVLTPLDDNYPNLEIDIRYNYENDPLYKAYVNDVNSGKYQPCGDEEEAVYQQISDKIFKDNYSDELKNNIHTAQLVADSVSLTK